MTAEHGPNFAELKVLPDVDKLDEPIAVPIKRSKKFETNTHQLIADLDTKRDEAKVRILNDIKDRQQLRLIPTVIDALQYVEDTERIDKFFFQLEEIYVGIINEMIDVVQTEYIKQVEYRRLLKKYKEVQVNAVNEDTKGNKQTEVLKKIGERLEKEIEAGATIGRLTGLRLGIIRQIQVDDSISIEEKPAIIDAVSQLISQFLKKVRENVVDKTEGSVQASEPDSV